MQSTLDPLKCHRLEFISTEARNAPKSPARHCRQMLIFGALPSLLDLLPAVLAECNPPMLGVGLVLRTTSGAESKTDRR